MSISPECETARLQVMAALDGETAGEPVQASHRDHVSTCEACRQWLKEMETMSGTLRTLTYPAARVELWSAVEPRIREDRRTSAVERLWPLGVAVLALRALQLFVDLPLPWLHPIVAMAVIAFAIWQVGGSLLAIETTAPELQKRGA